MTTKPGNKIEKAFQYAVENGGNVSKSMELAGYSKAYSKNPHKLTNTDKWQKLIKKYFPDKLIAQKINELMNAEKITKRFVQGKVMEEVTQTDTYAVSQGVGFALKATGKLIDKHEVQHRIITPLLDVSQHQGYDVMENTTNQK